MSARVAEVADVDGPKALVMVGDGKFFSNGLDLEWIVAHRDEAKAFFVAIHDLFAQLLVAPFPTVAAIQGHAYAAGAMVALAHDVRIMREDRGYLCLPEVDIRLPFTPGMSALVSCKLTPQSAHQAMVFGRRYAAPDALAAGIVDEVASEVDLLPRAIACAEELAGKDAATIGAIKRGLYGPVLAALDDERNSAIAGIFDH